MRVPFTKLEQLHIWRRDAWYCRYCLAPLFFAPTLQLLARLNPGHGYYHQNGKDGVMMPLFADGWASVDHILPCTLGGTNATENLAAACMRCNIQKGNKPPATAPPLQDIPGHLRLPDWDGLCLLYPQLVGREDAWTKTIRMVYGSVPP